MIEPIGVCTYPETRHVVVSRKLILEFDSPLLGLRLCNWQLECFPLCLLFCFVSQFDLVLQSRLEEGGFAVLLMGVDLNCELACAHVVLRS